MMLRAFYCLLAVFPVLSCTAQTPSPPAPPADASAASSLTSARDDGTTAAASATPAPARPKVTYSQCNVEGSYVAITFDDGPHGAHTPRLLDMLKQRGIKGTFYVVGQCAAEFPQIMKRIVAEGHEIASHSWSHPLLSKMSDDSVREQLQRTHDVILQTTGVAPKTMRPPYGGFTERQRRWAHEIWGYKTILWDVDPLDWKVRNAARVHGEIMRQTVPGSIILTHDIHKSTVDAMPETLDALTAKGFKFVTVTELIAMDRPLPPKPRATPAPKAPAAAPSSSATPTPKAPAATPPPAAPQIRTPAANGSPRG